MKANDKDKVNKFGPMDAFMREHGKTIGFTVMEDISIKMVRVIQENGLMVRKKVKVMRTFQMDANTMDNM